MVAACIVSHFFSVWCKPHGELPCTRVHKQRSKSNTLYFKTTSFENLTLGITVVSELATSSTHVNLIYPRSTRSCRVHLKSCAA